MHTSSGSVLRSSGLSAELLGVGVNLLGSVSICLNIPLLKALGSMSVGGAVSVGFKVV